MLRFTSCPESSTCRPRSSCEDMSAEQLRGFATPDDSGASCDPYACMLTLMLNDPESDDAGDDATWNIANIKSDEFRSVAVGNP